MPASTETSPRRGRGRPEVEQKLSHVHTRLPPDLHDAIIRLASLRGVSVSQMARALITRGLTRDQVS
jgi:hypothetical protein